MKKSYDFKSKLCLGGNFEGSKCKKTIKIGNFGVAPKLKGPKKTVGVHFGFKIFKDGLFFLQNWPKNDIKLLFLNAFCYKKTYFWAN